MTIGRETIGVFGANGFIGRNLVSRLISLNRSVVAFGRSFPADYAALVGGPVETRVIDFNDVLATHAVLQDVTAVVQLINSSSPGLGNTRVVPDLNANVVPHVSFIESCLLTGVSRFLFLSSGGTVYGNPAYLPIDEAHATAPINSYGLTKMMVEHYLRMLAHGSTMSYFNLRVSNPFGPGQTLKKGQGLVASILRSHAAGLPITIFGDGTVQRDYLYIDDLIDSLVGALDAPPAQETINIGSGVGRSVLEVVSATQKALAEELRLEFQPARPTDATANILDPSKAAALLGWRPRVDFDEALRRTVLAWQ